MNKLHSSLGMEPQEVLVQGLASGSENISRWRVKLFFTRLHEKDAAMWLSGWMFLLLSGIFTLGLQWDTREILGLNPWIKPIKFSLSISIYLWTIGWLLSELKLSQKVSAFFRWSIIGTMWLEIFCIALQSARGTTSHFNEATPFDGAVFGIMGAGILWNTVIAFCIWVVFFLPKKLTDELKARKTYLLSIRWGLFLFLAGSAVGGIMVKTFGHTVGSVDGGPGLPLVNWSTIAGDLRVAHFFGIHAIQVLPLLGFILESKPSRWIHGLSLLYMAWLTWVYFQAAMALPFL